MDDKAYCACLLVEYKPIEVGAGKMRENWECASCGSTFIRKSAHYAIIESARKKNEGWLADKEKLEKKLEVMNEKSLDGYEFMVDCSGYISDHPNDNEVKNLLFEIRKLVDKVESLEVELIFAGEKPEQSK